MRIDQLKYLIEISNSPSINIASEKLHISYQALSHSMKALEEELGITLLRRTNKGTSLTKEGYKLVALSKQFLLGIEDLQKKKETPCFHETVRFLVTAVSMEYLLSEFIYELQKKFPNLKLQYSISHFEKMYTMLKKGNNMFAFGFLGESGLFNGSLSEDICFHKIFSSTCKCLCSPMHELAQYQSVSLQQLQAHKLAIRNVELLEGINQNVFSKENIICEANPVMFNKLISSGTCFAIAQSLPFAPYQIPPCENTVMVRIKEDTNIEFGLFYRADFVMNSATEFFIRSFLQKFGFEAAFLDKINRCQN